MIEKHLFRIDRQPIGFRTTLPTLEILSAWIDRVLAHREATKKTDAYSPGIEPVNLLRTLLESDTIQVSRHELNQFTTLLIGMANARPPTPQPPGTPKDETGFQHQLTACTLAGALSRLTSKTSWNGKISLALMD